MIGIVSAGSEVDALENVAWVVWTRELADQDGVNEEAVHVSDGRVL